MVGEKDWITLNQISGFTKEQIEGIIGLSAINPVIVSGTLFFTHPEKYQQVAQELYTKWKIIFD